MNLKQKSKWFLTGMLGLALALMTMLGGCEQEPPPYEPDPDPVSTTVVTFTNTEDDTSQTDISAVGGSGAARNLTLTVPNTTEDVYFVVSNVSAQTIAVSGADAAAVTQKTDGTDVDGTISSATLAVFTVDTTEDVVGTDISDDGGSKVFKLTVSESGKTSIVYTVTLFVQYPPWTHSLTASNVDNEDTFANVKFYLKNEAPEDGFVHANSAYFATDLVTAITEAGLGKYLIAVEWTANGSGFAKKAGYVGPLSGIQVTDSAEAIVLTDVSTPAVSVAVNASPVYIGGVPGDALSGPVTLTINLTGAVVKSTLSSVDATSWFAPQVTGLTYTAAGTAGDSSFTIVVNGTPGAALTGSITITIPSTWLKYKNGVSVSGDKTAYGAYYNIVTAKVAAPTASPAGGSYPGQQVDAGDTITLSSTTGGATFYYTIDGTTPTTGSSSGESVIVPSTAGPFTLKAIATKALMTNSDELTAYYRVKSYTINNPTGYDNSVQAQVTFSPTSDRVKGKIITATITLTSFNPSSIEAGEFTINLTSATNQVSITGSSQTYTVAAGNLGNTSSITTYSFPMPTSNVIDLALTFTFAVPPITQVSLDDWTGNDPAYYDFAVPVADEYFKDYFTFSNPTDYTVSTIEWYKVVGTTATVVSSPGSSQAEGNTVYVAKISLNASFPKTFADAATLAFGTSGITPNSSVTTLTDALSKTLASGYLVDVAPGGASADVYLAFPATDTLIDTISKNDWEGFDFPVSGGSFDTTPGVIGTANYTSGNATYYKYSGSALTTYEPNLTAAGATATGNSNYILKVTLNAKPGFKFAEDVEPDEFLIAAFGPGWVADVKLGSSGGTVYENFAGASYLAVGNGDSITFYLYFHVN
jgi:hypothetical protein